MQLIICLLFAALECVTLGTDGRDVPVSARILDDGSCVVVVQSSSVEGYMSYQLALVPGDGTEPLLAELDTGVNNPAWTRGCSWISGSTFALQLSSWETITDYTEILVFDNSLSPTRVIRLPGEGSLDAGSSGNSEVSAALYLPGRSVYVVTVDLCDSEYGQLVCKSLLCLNHEGDTLEVSDIPVEGWWMNPDVIRPMPDGGCAVGSDEDGFSDILYVSRFDRYGHRLWSAEFAVGGEMQHAIMDILPARNGGTLLVATTDLFILRDHCLALLLDRNGEIVNDVLESGLGNMICTCGLPMDDGGFLLAGWTTESGADKLPVLMMLNSSGGLDGLLPLEKVCDCTEPLFLLENGDGYTIVGSCWETDDYYSADIFVETITACEINK